MMFSNFGDQARTFILSRQSSELKSQLERASTELATGQVQDTAQAVGGNFSALAEIEEAVSSIEAFTTANSEAAFFVENAQSSLEFVQKMTTDAAPALLLASNTNNNSLINTTTLDTKQKLVAVVSAINTQSTGRSLFSGQATDRPPLASVDDMIADLAPLVATETTAAGAMGVIDAWFDDAGGGFETMGYTGSNATLAPFGVGPGRTAAFDITAKDDGIKDALKGLMTAALVSQGTLAAQPDARNLLLQMAGETLLSNENELSALRAAAGTAEAHIEEMRIQNETERHALDHAYNRIMSADPYSAATELEAVQTQLETLYTITARLSRLNLVDFLR
ncbi:flagellin [Falsihalocynthiibacter sp. SS001]|uniref:flagellin n=1 Tax=Falsihalocynthiibacter sp. SS001 TaxID=3349698 RepID=UPI0036D3C5D6